MVALRRWESSPIRETKQSENVPISTEVEKIVNVLKSVGYEDVKAVSAEEAESMLEEAIKQHEMPKEEIREEVRSAYVSFVNELVRTIEGDLRAKIHMFRDITTTNDYLPADARKYVFPVIVAGEHNVLMCKFPTLECHKKAYSEFASDFKGTTHYFYSTCLGFDTIKSTFRTIESGGQISTEAIENIISVAIGRIASYRISGLPADKYLAYACMAIAKNQLVGKAKPEGK